MPLLATLAINLSPFMRFDGYFLLSDALDVPNLHERSFALARWWLRRVVLGWDSLQPEPEMSPRWRQGLIAFALLTWVYRLFLYLGIAWLVYQIGFKVLALPDRTLKGRINYVSAAIDPSSRRLMVRATIDNADGALKPEMFANVTIFAAPDHPAVGVPRQALIYEGDQVRLWVAHDDDRTIELRTILVRGTDGVPEAMWAVVRDISERKQAEQRDRLLLESQIETFGLRNIV